MNLRITYFIACAVALISPHSFAGMYKCKDEKGKISFSDTLCVAAQPPPQKANTTQVNKLVSGKLTETGVALLVKHSAVLATALDYRGQCALAGPDLMFTITDYSTNPPAVSKGGKAEICAVQRTAAEFFETNSLTRVAKLNVLKVTLNASSNQAALAYESASTVSQQGQIVRQSRCVYEDVVSVYGDRMLWTKLTAICKPT